IMRSKLDLTLHIERDLPPLSSDRQKVKQILLNLLSNALKFTHQGGVTVSVRRNKKDHTLLLSVVDTGIGIAAEQQERIFEDFRQLDNSPTRAYGGTGLGLSICRRLAQMLDGKISVHSEPGQGATFTLSPPIRGRKRARRTTASACCWSTTTPTHAKCIRSICSSPGLTWSKP